MKIQILDCTLRDGGYYTNWDFNKVLVDKYLAYMNKLPIDYIEVGYRSNQNSGYGGEYYYLPSSTIKHISKNTEKKIAVMINAKDNISPDVLLDLVSSVSLIRITSSPDQLSENIKLAQEIKNLGFEVAMNVMYISKIDDDHSFYKNISNIEEVLSYLYLVDSYGSIYPNELDRFIKKVRSKTSVKLGFHGHNNIELAFSNSLTAIDNGVEIIDSTVLGMGRGAGNLKTELILTHLNLSTDTDVDLNALGALTESFQALHQKFKWGGNLAYMVSGVYSLPQSKVMDALEIDRYSLTGIINQLQRSGENSYNFLENITGYNKCLIIGGGESVNNHLHAIKEYIQTNPDVLIIHSSARHAECFYETSNAKAMIIAGDKILKVKDFLKQFDFYVVGPAPRNVNIEIDDTNDFYELRPTKLLSDYPDSPLSISLGAALELGIYDIDLVGFDGYSELKMKKELYLMHENQKIIDEFVSVRNITSLTPTSYSTLNKNSIYCFI